MMRIIKHITLLICLLLAANNNFAQEAKGFELELDKDTILIGDHLTLSVKYKFNSQFAPIFPTIKDTVVPGVEFVRDLPTDTIRQQDQISEYVKKYIITSFDSGHYYMMFPIIAGNAEFPEDLDTIASNIVHFHVNTIPVDTLTYKMFDIKAQIEYPVTLGEILFWCAIVIAAVAIIIALVILYRRWKNKQPLFGKPKPKIPPHVIAFKELSQLRTEKLWQQGKIKMYYTRITDILRKYIEDRFAISAMEKTSDEILADIKKNKIDEMYSYNHLCEMFYTSDLAKFAKYQPTSSENEESLKVAFEFVTNTQPHEEETDAKNSDNTTSLENTNLLKEEANE